MLGFPLGILSAAGAGGEPVIPDYELISTTVLGSNTSTVTFSSLGTYSATYKHLQIRMTARTDRNNTSDLIRLRINGDAATNHTWHRLSGNASSVTSDNSVSPTEIELRQFSAAQTASNIFGGMVVDIIDPYSTTKNKTVRALGGLATSAVNEIRLVSGAWRSTSAVSSISLVVGGGSNIVTGSRFSLYGIKG